MKLEIGAGARAHDGYLAVDINAAHADIIADAQNLPFAAASVTGIRAIDVLEHCSYRDTNRVLAEWARVCAPLAELYVQVPSAGTIMRWFAASDDRLLNVGHGVPKTHLGGATWRLLGGHNDGVYAQDSTWIFNAHFALFTRESLSAALDAAGFEVSSILENPHPNLCASARRCRS